MSINFMISRMKASFNALLIAAILFIPACAGIQPNARPDASRHSTTPDFDAIGLRIDSILADPVLAPSFIGLTIMSVDDGTVLYDRNAEKLFHPASNMKLFTTSLALALLGTDYSVTTRFYADGTMRDGILQGNLVVKGAGDPILAIEDFDSVAAQLHRIGIHSITGDLIGDISYFDSLSWGKGWMWDDEPYADEAFISPFTVNDNSVTITVAPGKRDRDPLSVSINPMTGFLTVQNSGVTSDDTTQPRLEVGRPRGMNAFYVRGTMSSLSGVDESQLSVCHPELYFLTLLRERLAGAGISVGGGIQIGTIARGAEVASISHPLDSILHEVNKPSNNLAAENLLKIIAAERYGVPGIAENGLILMKAYLAGLGVDTTSLILADGSGVSWYNAVTPSTILTLLHAQYRNQKTFRHFYESLPLAGTDGTLRRRMLKSAATGNVHAKTGSLTGVSSLSGYVTTPDGKMLAFSMMMNHFPLQLDVLRRIQDKIMELLAGTTYPGR